MTPSCATSCPTCGEPLPTGAFYGPCASCRTGIRDRADVTARAQAEARAKHPPEPESVPPAPTRPPQMHAASEIVGHCEHCTRPVYGNAADQDVAAHPCCAYWAAAGFDTCYSCNPPVGRIPPEPPMATPVPVPAALRATGAPLAGRQHPGPDTEAGAA